MKLFLRDQILLLVFYLIQLLIITAIYWLDGYHHMKMSLYAAFLSGCLLIGYLCIRYLMNRSFYTRLEKPSASVDDFSFPQQQAPLAQSLDRLLKSQFRHYKTDLHNYKYKLENHTQFINQWVHQMKTPLSVIHLMIQDEDNPRFTAIGDELDRLKKGLEMVLYTSRLENFEHDFYVETLDLQTVVRAAVSNQKRLFIRRRIFPSFQFEEDLRIASDEKWLSFALTQIITNALRYTIDEGRKIYFYGYQRENQVFLEIRDEGVGIPASDLSRVFHPYFTGENGRNFQESTGMGLYLAKQICKKLGHRIEIQSAVNKGTTVRIAI
ncbi:sensor histidine kinase [Bacillus sp. MUM 13]|uniref:sensor histidine kinase n=1 Tax=Bacillus sp. MUM 13 TaxID=1678001 RepID=UPI0008F5798A|nr:sensor histidine kinase [Bacillus sp. MUM 13]OIK13890.1 hypothetical protein BIV59_04275 [Bacillus sp. MUM 13]